MTNFNSVKKFMQTFGQDVRSKAAFPDEKIVKLRYDLILEELNEKMPSIQHVLDARSGEVSV